MRTSRFVEKLAERLAEQDLAEGSRQRVVMNMSAYETWHVDGGGTPLDPDDVAISSVDLAEYRTYLLRRHKPSTVQRHMASLRTALKLLAPQLLATLRMPKVPQPNEPAPSGMSRTDRLAILRAAARLSTRDRLVVLLALMTGARASSIANLKVSGVKLAARSGSVEFDVAKYGKSYAVPANAELRSALAAWLAERPPVAHDFLLTSQAFPHGPIGRWTCHDIWHRRLGALLPAALRERLRGTHQARHALGRLLAEQGVPLPDIARILNHSPNSISVTARYLQPSQEDLQKHLERVIGEEVEE